MKDGVEVFARYGINPGAGVVVLGVAAVREDAHRSVDAPAVAADSRKWVWGGFAFC